MFGATVDLADTASGEKVDIRRYNVIYNIVEDVDKALKGMLDLKKAVAAGHSRGGTAAVLAAAKEKRFIACVAMCPSGPEKLEGDNKPAWLLVSGDEGDEKTCAAIYKQAAKPRFNITVAGMDHFFSPRGKAEVVVRVATAFLNYKVKGDARYKDHLARSEGVAVESEE